MDNNSGSGLGIVGVLLVVFVVLKLTGLVAWSWLWVLSPAWVCLGLWALIVAPVAAVTWWRENNRWRNL